jgi:hypothetical protein
LSITYNEHVHTLYRAGLFELPLAQSPGQRLDDLAAYGYYTTHAGLNSLTLAQPRWGAQLERTVGSTRLDLTADLGAYNGSAYGGKPVPTGVTTSAQSPEFGLWVRTPIVKEVSIGGEFLTGQEHIVPTGRAGFNDSYTRTGGLLTASYKGLELQAEQWFGHDNNSDGFGTSLDTSGGYARLRYFVTPHAYLAVRYDAAENPAVLRDWVYYGALQVTPHARLVLQQVHLIGGATNFGGAVTIGFPWPRGL